ncbi:LacI family DNA-binding transcriptional regulator [Cohnella zeiphila]|uniref:LacI family DNA-binding transcriptional regulator n=1 Tax=Cohnella zeiphila TaxID=2761120 RepID=A0A7X0SPQ4_9BACL|nr:LacI family DNA-binding transcriptional regulator [Cohnella zeiphila]MBB6733816.1 LacI family DNA-binding transcriptional regulator [Cohnella zeiphila]
MAGKRVTLKDIAERTNYTINTVSRALKDKEDIALETRKKIQRLAKEMGYIENSVAGSLRSGYSKTIAVIVGDISNPHFGIIVKEIEKAARKHRYTIIVLNTEDREELEESAIRTALSKNVDGIIICPSQRSEDNIWFLQRTGVPFVLIGRRFKSIPEFDYVICDDEKGGYLATKYLLDTGHKRILFLNGPLHISSAEERYEGYKKALQEYGVPLDPQLVREPGLIQSETRHLIRSLIEEGVDFTGVFAFNDVIAWETIYMLQKLGYGVPKDYSVIGFDNINARIFSPSPLTSISNSKSKMSRRALDILLKKINESQAGKSGGYREVVDTRLVVRDSTRNSH